MTEEQYQCIGCGAEIQVEEPEEKGYLPLSAFEKGKEKGEFYCQRCFRLRHYNELQDLDISEELFLDRLNLIAEDDAFVIQVIDLFDIEGTVISGLERFIQGQPYIVVGNKLDILPKSVKENRIRHWLKEQLYINGLHPEEVILLSATKQSTLETLISIIEKEIHHHNIYIVGVTNVGKSTLINQLIQYYGGEANIITTSNFPGTTLDLIEIPLTDNNSIIDTPGIIRQSQAAHLVSRQSMQKLLPTKPIKPRTFQLNSNQSIFFGGMAWLDFVKGDKTAFTFYVNNDLYLHRTKTENAENIYQEHIGELLSPPMKHEVDDYPELTSIDIQLNAEQDLVISSLGWVTVNKSVQLRLHLPKRVHYSIRQQMI
ncbi:ribosome biogenesis GTPase YqeH [Aerococcaceae bacterium DSM 111020]|nr:ribosome biogenesis GTPase YqeH [Aerococcaceae bacterium DSM 111020]